MKKLPVGLLTVMLCGILAGCSGEGVPKQNTDTKAPEITTEARQQTEAAAAEMTDGAETTESSKPETVKLRVAYHPNFGGNNLYITAEKNGFFEEEGLVVEPVKFTAGPQEIAAMVAGDVDIGYIGHTPCTLGWYGKYHCLVQDIPKGSTNLVHISYCSRGEAAIRAGCGVRNL